VYHDLNAEIPNIETPPEAVSNAPTFNNNSATVMHPAFATKHNNAAYRPFIPTP
jgi:hypothetical protein